MTTATHKDDRAGLTKAAVLVVTGLLLMSGAALAGREDTIDFNRDLLRERLQEGCADRPAAMSRDARMPA